MRKKAVVFDDTTALNWFLPFFKFSQIIDYIIGGKTMTQQTTVLTTEQIEVIA